MSLKRCTRQTVFSAIFPLLRCAVPSGCCAAANVSRVIFSAAIMHMKCRNTERAYVRSSVHRLYVPDARVDWAVQWPEYSPEDYTDGAMVGKPWADNANIRPRWNTLDNGVDRRSYMGNYAIDEDGRPRNPMGRTGLRGRGVLGRWGPNHAADPIVSMFRQGRLHFIGIERHDTHEWALPGGMVDPDELISGTLKREFTEEALEGVESKALEGLWPKGVELYRGYVDDPRNTDNAWMETVVVNFHDADKILENVNFKAGSDAADVRWIPVSASERLYASHEHFIRLLAKHHGVPFDE